MSATIVGIKPVDAGTDELRLSDGRSIKVWNYKAAPGEDLNEADGEVAIGSSLVDESKDEDGNTIFRFYSARTMYVLASVERRYPADLEHAKERVNLGWTTDLDDEVDMDNYPAGEDRGPGGIRFVAGFCWRPPVGPVGKVTVKGMGEREDDDSTLFSDARELIQAAQDGVGDSGGYYPEPNPDDFHPGNDGPVFVSLDTPVEQSAYSSDRDDEENRDD
jgi:hypothetical protein